MRPIEDDQWVRQVVEHGLRTRTEHTRLLREAMVARPGRRRDRAGRRPRKRG